MNLGLGENAVSAKSAHIYMHSIFTAAQLSAALQILNTWYLYEMTIDIPYRYVDYVAKLWYIIGQARDDS